MVNGKLIILLGLVALATARPSESNRREATSEGGQRQWTYELHRRSDYDRESEAEFFDRLFEDLREDRYAGEYPPFVSLPDYEVDGEEDRLLDEFDLQDPSLDGELAEESHGADGIGGKPAGKPREQGRKDGLENGQASANEAQPSNKVERNETTVQQGESKGTPNNRPSEGAQPQGKHEDPIQAQEEKNSEKHHDKPAESDGNQRPRGEKAVGAPRPKDSQPEQENEQEQQSQDERSEAQQPSAVANPRERPSVSSEPQGNPAAPLVQINVNVAQPA